MLDAAPICIDADLLTDSTLLLSAGLFAFWEDRFTDGLLANHDASMAPLPRQDSVVLLDSGRSEGVADALS